jgi:hypothetical protein
MVPKRVTPATPRRRVSKSAPATPPRRSQSSPRGVRGPAHQPLLAVEAARPRPVPQVGRTLESRESSRTWWKCGARRPVTPLTPLQVAMRSAAAASEPGASFGDCSLKSPLRLAMTPDASRTTDRLKLRPIVLSDAPAATWVLSWAPLGVRRYLSRVNITPLIGPIRSDPAITALVLVASSNGLANAVGDGDAAWCL